jgi:hypothetical protein
MKYNIIEITQLNLVLKLYWINFYNFIFYKSQAAQQYLHRVSERICGNWLHTRVSILFRAVIDGISCFCLFKVLQKILILFVGLFCVLVCFLLVVFTWNYLATFEFLVLFKLIFGLDCFKVILNAFKCVVSDLLFFLSVYSVACIRLMMTHHVLIFSLGLINLCISQKLKDVYLKKK